jgi:hypothetical protein
MEHNTWYTWYTDVPRAWKPALLADAFTQVDGSALRQVAVDQAKTVQILKLTAKLL